MRFPLFSALMAATLMMLPAAAAPHAEAMMKATFKLYNKSSTATCFLLRDGSEVFVVSAAHTFANAKGDSSLIVLRERDEEGVWKRKDVKIQIRNGEEILWTKHPKYDLAAMRVNLELAEDATLPLDVVKPDGFPAFGDPVMLLTYPGRVEANGAGFPLARTAIVGSFPSAPLDKDPVFVLDATAWGGDSGGPVIVDGGNGQPQIVGLVIERINYLENVKSEHESREVRTSMGLSKALASAIILETIRLAKNPVNVPASAPEAGAVSEK